VIIDEKKSHEPRRKTCEALRQGKSVCIHTQGTEKRTAESNIPQFGATLGNLLADVLRETPVKRVLIAGGDTSSQIARALKIESVEMIAELTRGSPLCRAASANPVVNGLEVTFKGGQIGSEDFFGLVQNGRPDTH
jgi:uncharacterized protein YgbK (DUF1537 family)